MNEIEELRDQLTDRLLDEGVLTFFQHDADSVNHGGYPWAYTVGRTLADRPELLVTGLGEATCRELIAELVNADVHPDTPMETCVGRVAFILAETGLLHAAYCVFGSFTALQVIWTGDGPQPLHPAGGLIITDPYPED